MTTANDRPWDVRLWLYPGASPAVSADSWGLEQDISGYIRHVGSEGGQAITYARGKPDAASRVDPGSMTLTLDNSDGRFSTRNAMGPYYPLLARNTPIRLGVVCGFDTFATAHASGWGTSSSGNTWTLTGSASDWTVAGGVGTRTFSAANTAGLAVLTDADAFDVDVTMTVAVPNVATGAALAVGPLLRYTDSSNFYGCRLEFNSAGDLTVKIQRTSSTAGTADIAAINPIPASTYSAGQRWTVRAQAHGNTLRMKYWLESGTQPATWALSVDDTANTGAGIGVYLLRANGNTNAGIQFNVDDYQAIGIEYTGAVVKWPARWNMRSTSSWAPITAAGILRRFQKAKRALQSPLARQLPSYNPTAYWTLEDAANATTFASAVAGGRPARFGSATPAADSTLSGGADAPTLSSATGFIRGQATRQNGGTGFSAMFFMKLAALPASKTVVAQFKAGGRVTAWKFSLDATTQYLDGYDSDGVAVVSTFAFHGGDYTQWMALQLETEVVGANTQYSMINHQVGLTTYYAMPGSYASTTVSKVTQFVLGGTQLDNCAFAHVWLGENTLPFVTDTFSLVSSGYAGESASARVTRVATEAGFSVVVEPGTSEPMGTQRRTTPLGLVQSCEDADFGTLYEHGTALGYQPRSARYNKPPLFDLSVAAGEIAEAPEPIDDDQELVNAWTVIRDDGSSALAEDADSIAAEGEYADQVTINVATDDVLPGHAQIRRLLGTLPELRWPSVTLDFSRNPSLLTQWRARTHGFRLTIATGLSQIAGYADPDLIAEGYTATLTPQTWTAELNCSSATAWDTGVYDGTTRPYDSGSTTLGGAYASSATALLFLHADTRDAWSTTRTPYPALISGEQVTVTSMAPVSQVISTADGTFEAGLNTWAGYGGTFVQSAVQAHGGTKSGLLTVAGSPSQAYARAAAQPIMPSTEYRAQMWVWVASTRNVLAVFDWLDSGGGYISGASTTTSVTGGVWTQITVTGTSAANAVYAQYGPTLGSSPANGTILYLDDVDILTSATYTGSAQRATVVRGVNGVTKTLPAGSAAHYATPGRYAL